MISTEACCQRGKFWSWKSFLSMYDTGRPQMLKTCCILGIFFRVFLSWRRHRRYASLWRKPGPVFFQTRVAGFRVCNQFSTPSVLDALAWSFFAQIRFFQSLILKKRKKNIGYLVVAISSPWPVVVSGGIVLHIDGTARARYRSKWWRFYIFREDSENRLNRRENSPLWVILKNAFPLTRGIVLSTILRKDGKIFARVFLWGYFVQV